MRGIILIVLIFMSTAVLAAPTGPPPFPGNQGTDFEITETQETVSQQSVDDQEPSTNSSENNMTNGNLNDLNDFLNYIGQQQIQSTVFANTNQTNSQQETEARIDETGRILEEIEELDHKIRNVEDNIGQRINTLGNTVQQTQAATATEIQKIQETTNKINTILTITVINSLLVFIILIGLAGYVVQKKHPFIASKVKNKPAQYIDEPDAKRYTEVYSKLVDYIKTNLKHYSYESIKRSLIQEGFTAEEIDAVYLEIKNAS